MSNRALRRLDQSELLNFNEEENEEIDRTNNFKYIYVEEKENQSNESESTNQFQSSKKFKKSKKRVSLFKEENAIKVNDVIPQCLPYKNCMNIEMKYINQIEEMNKLFGNLVVSEHQKKAKTQHKFVKKSKLANPKAEWPPLMCLGISMEIIPEENYNDEVQFLYKHSQKYQKLQKKFCENVLVMNQTALMELFHEHPYHIDTLIQISLMMRFHNDFDIASNLIEQALYALESEFHPRFKLSDRKNKLPYRYRENRSIHIALFYHMCSLNYNACFRTSLGMCKLMLNLDESDPLAILNVIDRLALKSRQYEFLIHFYVQYGERFKLCERPNLIYSLALAHKLYHIDRLTSLNQKYRGNEKQLGNNNANRSRPKQPDRKILPELTLTDQEIENRADLLLSKALLKFPWVLFALLKKCAIDQDNFCGSFKSTTFNSFCKRARNFNLPKTLRKIIDHYADDTEQFWKQTIPELGGDVGDDNLMLFDWIANVIRDNIDSFTAITEFQISMETYDATPLNYCRHYTLLSQYLDSMSQNSLNNSSSTYRVTPLIPEEYTGTVVIYDPFPPPDSIEAYPLDLEQLTFSNSPPQNPVTRLNAAIPTTTNQQGAEMNLEELTRMFRGFLVSLIPPNVLTGNGDLSPSLPPPNETENQSPSRSYNFLNTLRNYITPTSNEDNNVVSASHINNNNDLPASILLNSNANPHAIMSQELRSEPEVTSTERERVNSTINQNNNDEIELIGEGFGNRNNNRSQSNSRRNPQ